jgi:hypothetical protein
MRTRRRFLRWHGDQDPSLWGKSEVKWDRLPMVPCGLREHHEEAGRTECARFVGFKLENRIVDRSGESHNAL